MLLVRGMGAQCTLQCTAGIALVKNKKKLSTTRFFSESCCSYGYRFGLAFYYVIYSFSR